MTRPAYIRLLAMAATAVLSWALLSVGSGGDQVELHVGDPAPRDYFAARAADVPDEARTEAIRDAREAEVQPVYERRAELEQAALDEIDALFAAVAAGVAAEPLALLEPGDSGTADPSPATTSTTLADSATAQADDSTTTTTEPVPGTATITGVVYADIDRDGTVATETGDLGIDERPIEGIHLRVSSSEGDSVTVQTDADGAFSAVVMEGEIDVFVDTDDAAFPEGFAVGADAEPITLACRSDETCDVGQIPLVPNTRPIDIQVTEMAARYQGLKEGTTATLVTLANGDVIRAAYGEDTRLQAVQQAAANRLSRAFDDGIRDAESLLNERNAVLTNPPLVFFAGGRDADAGAAAADIVSLFMAQNEIIDEAATVADKQAQRDAVETVTVPFLPGQLIAGAGETFTALDIEAINETGAAEGRPVRELAMLGILAVLVGVLAFYLSRFRPQIWARPRMVTLWGLLVVLAAAAVRGTAEFQDVAGWFVLPAVAFGYLAAVLFDNRMGTLMALALAVLVAVGTRDAGVTVYGLLATLTPIGFVSAVSTRRAFRNSVVVSSLAVGVIAATIAWFFHADPDGTALEAVVPAAGWGVGVSLVAALVALAAMPFFESVFDVTTTLRLLELTDRNHEALQNLQEKAFGTFNHSLMVGTLADAGAQAIGANNLLARAAAYYHDIGKTRSPMYYIENQFGVANPHDDLAPERSAEIIRQHVIDGMALAEKFRIPSEVSEGIVTHHGDAIMRYFYEKARQDSGEDELDPTPFRHVGHKPKSKEMAIVMLSDTVEAACRAIFSDEEPTPGAIEKVIDRVIDEKVADGQLSESSLTFGELTRIRRAFLDAMVGHYHSRISYPNFPGQDASGTATVEEVQDPMPAGSDDQSGAADDEQSDADD